MAGLAARALEVFAFPLEILARLLEVLLLLAQLPPHTLELGPCLLKLLALMARRGRRFPRACLLQLLTQLRRRGCVLGALLVERAIGGFELRAKGGKLMAVVDGRRSGSGSGSGGRRLERGRGRIRGEGLMGRRGNGRWRVSGGGHRRGEARAAQLARRQRQAVDEVGDQVLGGYRRMDLQLRHECDVVEGERVRGIGHRHEQASVDLEIDRHGAIALRGGWRQQVRRAGIHVVLRKVDVAEPVARGERASELVPSETALADKDAPHGLAGGARGLDSRLDVLLGSEAELHDHVTEKDRCTLARLIRSHSAARFYRHHPAAPTGSGPTASSARWSASLGESASPSFSMPEIRLTTSGRWLIARSNEASSRERN